MDRDYYRKYYQLERNHWWFRVRGKIIIDQLTRVLTGKANLKILNIGCATGRTTELLQQFGTVTSIEYDEECCQFCRAELGLQVVQASILSLPYPKSTFDLVCAFDVIEHVMEDQLAVCEMKRVCKPNGLLFVTMPAFNSLWSRHDDVNHHIRRYHRRSLLELFQHDEGSIVRSTYFNSLLFLPIYVFRSYQRIFKNRRKHKFKSDFEVRSSSVVDWFLECTFSIERYLLRLLSFPVGVSLMLIWRKK